MVNLVKFSEQQKTQRANKIKNTILKQLHDKHLAETFEPITKSLSKTTEAIERFVPLKLKKILYTTT